VDRSSAAPERRQVERPLDEPGERGVRVEPRLEPGLEHGSPVNGSLTLVDNDLSQMWASRGMFVRN